MIKNAINKNINPRLKTNTKRNVIGENMTLHLQMPSQVNNLSPRILVIGVGGAGGNIINSMKLSGVEGVEFIKC